MKNRILIIVVVIVGVAIAWQFFGGAALTGLLGLFIPTGKDNEANADRLDAEADEHEEMANHIVEEIKNTNDSTEELRNDITEIVQSTDDKQDPIQEVIEDGKEDWN